MEVKAQAKHIRISPRKTRLVADVIRGMDVEKARNQLEFINKRATGPVLKLLNSAIANALNNFKLKKENLYIKSITVDGGATLKRWKPRAFGRATPIRKRSAHISIVLGEKEEARRPRREKEAEKIKKPEVIKTTELPKVSTPKEVEEKEVKKKKLPKEYKKTKGFLKKIFSRKAGM